MRIARYALGADLRYGVIEGDGDDLAVAEIAGHPFGPVQLTGVRHRLADVRLLAPVLPSKVVGIGRNYAEHAKELGHDVPEWPLAFLKPSTAVVGPGDPIVHPPESGQVDFEGELAVVIGMFGDHLARRVPLERAYDVIVGYTCANDVTARDQQRSDGQWARAKGHDTFCPLGPWLETALDPADLRLRTELDGEIRQDARTSALIFDLPTLVAYVTSFMTLLPGDVILTGTPAGVGPMRPGQTVSVTVEGIGTLTNHVVAPAALG